MISVIIILDIGSFRKRHDHSKERGNISATLHKAPAYFKQVPRLSFRRCSVASKCILEVRRTCLPISLFPITLEKLLRFKAFSRSDRSATYVLGVLPLGCSQKRTITRFFKILCSIPADSAARWRNCKVFCTFWALYSSGDPERNEVLRV